MYLLDTNVVSELRRGKAKPSPAVLAWAASTQASAMFLCSITVLEVELGVLQAERRNPGQAAALRQWADGLRAAFSGRILAFTEEAALACARMHVPNPKSERDAMFVATARVHGFTVVTRNLADFAGTGVKLFDPWSHPVEP